MVVPLATQEQLPIIDITPLYDNDNPEQQAAVAAAIRIACLNTGFFYVSGQRLPQSGPIFKCMQQLFDLPDSSKQKLDANLSPLHRGYTGLGGAHNCVPDESAVKGPDNKESFLLGKCAGHAAADPSTSTYLHPLLAHPPNTTPKTALPNTTTIRHAICSGPQWGQHYPLPMHGFSMCPSAMQPESPPSPVHTVTQLAHTCMYSCSLTHPVTTSSVNTSPVSTPPHPPPHTHTYTHCRCRG
jgi:hypothetical protein